MANVARLKEKARASELNEQWQQALELYRQAVEEAKGEDAEIGIWNRIGDLELRLGQPDRAVQAYESAVDGYVAAELYNNAIALCNKILRVVPGRARVYLKLGQISAAQGFFADARANYLQYAERMQRAGELDASFQALKDFAALSPGDTEIRRLLAEQLRTHGRPAEAVEQLQLLLGWLVQQGDAAAADEVREQIQLIDPDADVSGRLPERADPAVASDRGDPGPLGLLPTLTLEAAADGATGDVDEAGDVAAETRADAGDAAVDAEVGLLDGFESHLGVDADAEVDDTTAEPLAEIEVPVHADADADGPDAEEDAAPLPLLDAAPAEDAAPEFEIRHDAPPAHEPGDDGEDEPEAAPALPLLDAVDAAPAETLDESVARLTAEHQELAQAGRFAEAAACVGRLIALRPAETAHYQKRVEYAFRAGDRDQLIPAYLALAGHLASGTQPEKANAVYQRVLELDPANEAARAALEPPRGAVDAPAATASAPADDYIDLGALILGDQPRQPTTRFVVEEEAPTGDEDRDFADMLSRFRQKVAENIATEDSASHYDLGVAFKEMGLLDEAIAQFQVALRGGAKPLATLELLGECFVEKGQHTLAARVLERALRLPGAAEGDLLGVFYLLARCEEAGGQYDRARELLERVLAVDIRFRDAAARLRALRSVRGGAG